RKYALGIHEFPDLTKDYTDRNRTSPLAFTGNKFKLRALGSSANPSMSITVLNGIVAESLERILDAIEKHLEGKKPKNQDELVEAILPAVRHSLRTSKPIRFCGDNYSQAWLKEAKKRKLPIIEKSIDAFEAYRSPSTVKAFEGILTKGELESRYEILAEQYAHNINIEANLMIE